MEKETKKEFNKIIDGFTTLGFNDYKKSIIDFTSTHFIDKRILEERIDAINEEGTFIIRDVPKKILLASDLKESLLDKKKDI